VYERLFWGVLIAIPFCVALGLGSQYFSEEGSLLEPVILPFLVGTKSGG